MVRGKTQLKRIENATSRQVTLAKRRNGKLTSSRCSVMPKWDLLFSPPVGSSTSSPVPACKKCWKSMQGVHKNVVQVNQAKLKIFRFFSDSRKILGECLESCSMKELNQLERQVERGLRHIRATKEQILREENVSLSKKFVDLLHVNSSTTPSIGLRSIHDTEVRTQLVMRPPDVQDHL